MEKKNLYIGTGLVFLILLSGVVFMENIFATNNYSNTNEISIIEFETDKSTYGSREDLVASLKIESSEDFEEVIVKIKGIQPYSKAYIENSKTVDLKKGGNEITFNEETPSCTSGCGGVSPGEYDLNIEVLHNEEQIANSTMTINLVS